MFLRDGIAVFNSIFLLICIPYFLLKLNIPSGGGLRVILPGELVWGFCWWLCWIFYVLECNGRICCSFWSEVFWNWGIAGFLWICVKISVIIWPICFLMKNTKNGLSLKLSSMVNFTLQFRFWSILCKSPMLHHRHLQNMKLSSKYILHDLINSVFILLLRFLPMISWIFL